MPARNDEFGDGTQSGLPPVPFGDALSGSLNDADDHDEFKMTKVASPVRPDPAAVRDLVDAAMAEGRHSDSPGDQLPQFGQVPPAGPAQPIPPAQPLGILPRQRTRPGLLSGRRPQLRMPRMGLPRMGLSRGGLLPPRGNLRRARPSNGSTAMIVAVLLMIIFAVVAIEFLTTLISSISGLFD
ncbi:hypothetical protein FHX82_002180 [Amycolatopsis bartoniae]|uniref:Uncharacterized protein n=1 Tax=Amycolatopsis bartoniae TaxID=941986 RepID=A0A8H9IXM9_9PSEU|nr:hypothetical protein [Amycolatopsis bartoniae]MBB2935160.1 hypothetical protein [Amycolatopsis bartoniae]TVT07030.1 hypothetical protein FNH07_18025 [Amycolatopsis bartoniae]GHF74797.1 hypothetical protein GCM10017566_55770 [Amycolatopsis bartoniae]